MLTSLARAPRVVARAHAAFIAPHIVSATSTRTFSTRPLPSLCDFPNFSKAFHAQPESRQNALPVKSTAPLPQSKPAPEDQDSPSSQKKDSAANLGAVFVGAAALTFTLEERARTLDDRLFKLGQDVAIVKYIDGTLGVIHDKQTSEPAVEGETKESTAGASHA
ncbi:hypothetical protein JCM10296v2_006106 [Rhodotorula toruloides]